MLKILFTLLVFPIAVYAQQSEPVKTYTEQKFIKHAFNKADVYMDEERYDSAQLWLNKIYIKLSYQKPSYFSYILNSRQAEVYYYNNLHKLGMQHAQKAGVIANILKDSVLIADACNFIGLFYLTNNKLLEAKKYFIKASMYCKQPPYKKNIYLLTNPHHIYANLAETYEKLNQADSSIYYSKLSLKTALAINWLRGIATAYLDLGAAYLLKNNTDSACKYFNYARIQANKSKNFDVELQTYSSLANCELAKLNFKQAYKLLDSGVVLLNKQPELNHFYASKFLDEAINICKKYGKKDLLVKTLELKSNIQSTVYNGNNTQIQSLLLMILQNEKRIFGLEITDVKNKQNLTVTKIYVLLLILVAFIIAFIAYRYYALQQLRLANLRTKISQDLHDEIGATLSGIALYSYITQDQIKNKNQIEVTKSLNLIKTNATDMVAKLNDIVWAINPNQDNFNAFIGRLKEFTLQIAPTKNIEVSFLYNPSLFNDLKLPMQHRKNIYLICKEAINNAVKYSKASLLNIHIKVTENNLTIEIKDNGIGFSPNLVKKGNGLINMAIRAKEVNADFSIDGATGIGTKIYLTCKIP